MKPLLLTCVLFTIYSNAFCQRLTNRTASFTYQSVNFEKLKSSNLTNFRTASQFGSFGFNQDESEFASNIVSIYPISYAKHDWDTSWNHDIGISYEWISGNGKFGFKLPLYYSTNTQGIYIDPVLKLYARGQGVCTYAVGPQFVLGSQTIITGENYNSATHSIEYEKARRTQFGLMFNNSLNITISHRFYIGAEFAFGAIIYNYPKLEPNVIGIIFFGPAFLVNPSLSAGISTGIRF
jgi:hypothetical protein